MGNLKEQVLQTSYLDKLDPGFGFVFAYSWPKLPSQVFDWVVCPVTSVLYPTGIIFYPEELFFKLVFLSGANSATMGTEVTFIVQMFISSILFYLSIRA